MKKAVLTSVRVIAQICEHIHLAGEMHGMFTDQWLPVPEELGAAIKAIAYVALHAHIIAAVHGYVVKVLRNIR